MTSKRLESTLRQVEHTFHPLTVKHKGDRVKVQKHPASGDSDGFYYGTLQPLGEVKWDDPNCRLKLANFNLIKV